MMCYWFDFTTSEIYPFLPNDVLLIWLHYFGDLFISLNFVTMLIILIDEVLERYVYEALLEFQAVAGCDQTGKFMDTQS